MPNKMRFGFFATGQGTIQFGSEFEEKVGNRQVLCMPSQIADDLIDSFASDMDDFGAPSGLTSSLHIIEDTKGDFGETILNVYHQEDDGMTYMDCYVPVSTSFFKVCSDCSDVKAIMITEKSWDELTAQKTEDRDGRLRSQASAQCIVKFMKDVI